MTDPLIMSWVTTAGQMVVGVVVVALVLIVFEIVTAVIEGLWR